jgi:hypothetical protein
MTLMARVLIPLFIILLQVGKASAQGGALYLTWVGVIDNGEGDGTHGPLGNLHLKVYKFGHQRLHTILEGPSSREYLDGDQIWYHVFLGFGPVYIEIYESDPGRSNDMLYEGWITVPGSYYSGYAAADDALRNALARGANSWATNVWRGGIQRGMPTMFIEISNQ